MNKRLRQYWLFLLSFFLYRDWCGLTVWKCHPSLEKGCQWFFLRVKKKKRRAMAVVQAELSLPTHQLITESPTRWGSRQKMTERVLEQEKAKAHVLGSKKKSGHLVFTWKDIVVLESVNKSCATTARFHWHPVWRGLFQRLLHQTRSLSPTARGGRHWAHTKKEKKHTGVP